MPRPVMLAALFVLTIPIGLETHAQGPNDPIGVGAKIKTPRNKLVHGAITVVSGPGDVAAATRHLRRRSSAVRHCFDRQLARGWAAKGKVTVELSINDDGRVTQSSIHQTSLPANPKLETCIKRMLRRVRFPPATGAVVLRVPYSVTPPPSFRITPHPGDPDVALARARTGREQARAALKRSRCLSRTSSKLLRLARRAKRAKKPAARQRLATQIEAAQAKLVACDALELSLGSGVAKTMPCGTSSNLCPGCLRKSLEQISTPAEPD